MLRRKPTPIHLTSEDLASYEDRQAREALAEAEAAALARANIKHAQMNVMKQGGQAQNKDPNDELRPLPNEKPRLKTREERLGMGGRS